MRREIAWTAARLLADGLAADHAHAKLKAARQLGVRGDENLPDDAEIEDFLRAHQDLFQASEHSSCLRALRTTALGVMERLSVFNPRLSGAVLDGTATETTPIEVDLYADDAKEVELFLVNANIRYRPAQGCDASDQVVLCCVCDDLQVRLTIRPALALRKTERRASDGAAVQRATITALQTLLNTPDP